MVTPPPPPPLFFSLVKIGTVGRYAVNGNYHGNSVSLPIKMEDSLYLPLNDKLPLVSGDNFKETEPRC